MNRQSNHSCIITMTILAVLILAPMASEADPPSADLGWGTYVCDPYSTEGAGPDAIRVKAQRKITPMIAFAFPDDGIQIDATEEKGFDIIAANAIGRGAGAKVVYVVFGAFLRGAGGQAQQGQIPTIWEADFRPSTDPVVLVLKDINSRVGTFDGESGVPDRVYFKAMFDLPDFRGRVEFWLLGGTGEYDWAIGTSNGKLNAANEYRDSKMDLAVGTHTLTVTKAGGFEREINFAVVAVSLYKNNTEWSAPWVLSATPDLFTLDRIAGIKIEGPGAGKEIKAKMWSSADPDPEHVATSHTNLAEDPAGVYRNTGTGRWPRFYPVWDSAHQRLKVTDEEDILTVYPIIDGTDQVHLSVAQKVDLTEMAAVDGTASLDAAQIYNDMVGSPHNWYGKVLYDVSHDPVSGTGQKCVDLGAEVDFLNVSGHGTWSTPKIWGDGGFGLNTDTLLPSDIGTSWDNGELEWCLFAACSQVLVDRADRDAEDPAPIHHGAADNGVIWIKKMKKVHALLGYRHTAPSGGKDVEIAQAFCERLAAGGANHNKVLWAWMRANRPGTYTCPGKYATALVRETNLDDKMYTADAFPIYDSPGSRYWYYYIKEDPAFPRSFSIESQDFDLP